MHHNVTLSQVLLVPSLHQNWLAPFTPLNCSSLLLHLSLLNSQSESAAHGDEWKSSLACLMSSCTVQIVILLTRMSYQAKILSGHSSHYDTHVKMTKIQYFFLKIIKKAHWMEPPHCHWTNDSKYKVKSYRGTTVEGPRPARFQLKTKSPTLCRTASAEGLRPLKMTSFRWIHNIQSVAKMSCHSDALQYGPSTIDLQKASSEDNGGRHTLVDAQTTRAIRHVTNMWSQSS